MQYSEFTPSGYSKNWLLRHSGMHRKTRAKYTRYGDGQKCEIAKKNKKNKNKKIEMQNKPITTLTISTDDYYMDMVSS